MSAQLPAEPAAPCKYCDGTGDIFGGFACQDCGGTGAGAAPSLEVPAAEPASLSRETIDGLLLAHCLMDQWPTQQKIHDFATDLQAHWAAQPSQGVGEPVGTTIVLTKEDVEAARSMIYECTGTDLISGNRPVRKEHRAWVYSKLCDAANLLLGDFAAPTPPLAAVPKPTK